MGRLALVTKKEYIGYRLKTVGILFNLEGVKMTGKFKTAITLSLVIPMLVLGGCGTIQKISGKGKNPPDEFAVITRPPLSLPPEYSLSPPTPGEATPQDLASSVETLRALFPNNENVVPQLSIGEAALLRSIEARALADVRSSVGSDTEVAEKGTLMEDITSIDERVGSPDGSSVDHVSSEDDPDGN